MELRAGKLRSVGMHRLASVVPVVLLLAACGPGPSPTPSTPELASGTVSGHGVTLSVTAEPAVAAAGAPIDVDAVVTNDGAETIDLSGSGSGFVFFSVTRLEDGLTSGEPAMSADCAPHILRPDEPVTVPFSKSGGWSDDDANAAFLRTYFAEPELTLPSGTWRIDVATMATIGQGCVGPQLDLEMSLVVRVTE